MSARYGLYFSPGDGCALASFGESVLLRTPTITALADLPAHITKYSHQWMPLLEAPRRYGFHATLKAPFELAAGTSADELHGAVDVFSRQCRPIVMHGLAPRKLHRFFALSFIRQPEPIKQLAGRCVQQFEKFRAPLTSKDVERRRPASLSNRQRDYLNRFGYPYVLDEFDFHMTLSGRLTGDESDFHQWLAETYHRLVTEPPILDRLAVYGQQDRFSAFVRSAEFVFPVV